MPEVITENFAKEILARACRLFTIEPMEWVLEQRPGFLRDEMDLVYCLNNKPEITVTPEEVDEFHNSKVLNYINLGEMIHARCIRAEGEINASTND